MESCVIRGKWSITYSQKNVLKYKKKKIQIVVRPIYINNSRRSESETTTMFLVTIRMSWSVTLSILVNIYHIIMKYYKYYWGYSGHYIS